MGGGKGCEAGNDSLIHTPTKMSHRKYSQKNRQKNKRKANRNIKKREIGGIY